MWLTFLTSYLYYRNLKMCSMTSWKITIKSSVYALIIKCITNKQTSMLNIGLNNSGVFKAARPFTFVLRWIFRKEKNQ